MLGALLPMGKNLSGRYVEPFAGSASLFFALEPQEAILGDLNGELTGALRQLRDNSAAVLREMAKLGTDSDSYYALRDQDPSQLTGAHAAARFFVLNKLCFNGLYRTNRAGKFNVPYGRHKTITVDTNLLKSAATLLRRAKIVHGDFEETLESTCPGDFVFLDPPYVTRSKPSFSEYLPDSFATKDLDRLEKSLIRLSKRGIGFAITYIDCEESRQLLERWKPKKWTIRRNIAGFSAHRRTCTELLATNLVKA